MKRNVLCFAMMSAIMAMADTFIWTGAESALWDTTTANWKDAGGNACTWVNSGSSYAVFGADSTVTNINVAEDVTLTNLAVNAGAYTFSGDGMMDVACLDVQEDATLVLGGFFKNSMNSILAKRYSGSLVVAGTGTVNRLSIYNGSLSLTSGSVITAQTAVVGSGDELIKTFHSDGGRINFLGATLTEVLKLFTHATLGEGGLTVFGSGDVTYYVDQCFETAAGVETDGGIKKVGSCVFSFLKASTFNGGVVAGGGQLRAQASYAFGTGTVTLNNSSTLFIDTNDVYLPNRIEQDRNSYIGGVESSQLTVTALGINGENVCGLLGRQNGGKSLVKLSLDPERSDPLSGFYVRGAFGLEIDGCGFNARKNALIPYFQTSNLTGVEPLADVGLGGLTFDTGVAWTEFGMAMKFAPSSPVTNVVETVDLTNGSFEESISDNWVTGALDEAPNGPPPSPQSNGSSFITSTYSDYYTTNGTKFAVLRRLNYMQQTFDVPSDGLWRVVFDGGCRPGGSYVSHLITITVKVDDDIVDEIPARGAKYTFRRFEMPPHQLTAGSHKFRFETGTSSVNYDAHFFDTVRLERLEVTQMPPGALVKTGVGSLTVTNVVTEGAIIASNGVLNVWSGSVTNGSLVAAPGATLAIFDVSIDGVTAEVAAGGTLELHGSAMTNATVNIAGGGTLAFNPKGPNLVKNCSFESSNPISNNKFERSTPRGWTMGADSTQNQGSPGLQSNGGTVSANWYATPYGDTTAYVRTLSYLSQSVDVPVSGDYALNFVHCARNYSDSFNIPVTVLVDDAPVLKIPARTAYYDYTRATTTNLTLTAGKHTIKFDVHGTLASGAMIFFDDVHLESAAPAPSLDGTVFNLSSGSTVALDNEEPIVLAARSVYVDGIEVRGSEKNLVRAGVTVTGGGRLQIGPPSGTLLIVR